MAVRGGPADAGEPLAAHVMHHCLIPADAIVAGFWPLPDEIDIRPLLCRLHDAGHTIALPETTRRGQTLIFRRWSPGARLVAGRFGTRHPEGERLEPSAILVPLLAFDRRGNRLGYGGGYYDRTLPTLPAGPRIGCAFAGQEVDAVPVEATDVRLDAIATERGVIFSESP